MGWVVRQRLLTTAQDWRTPCLCTLTGDPKQFDHNPRRMFETITAGGFIPELFKRLGVKRWVRVLEFHKSGFPHFHCMIDRADLSRGQIDYKLAWHLWRDTWGLGGLDFTHKKKNGDGSPITGARNQIFYLTKYLTKFPAEGFPQWVRDMHSIRFVQGCRALGPLVAPGKQQDAADRPMPSRPAYRARRSLGERMVDCGQGSRVYTVTECLGGVKFKFEGLLPVAPDVLRDMVASVEGLDLVEAEVAGRPSWVLHGGLSVEIIRRKILGLPC